MVVYATSERTRSALIQAAGELAAEKDFAEVSTRAIADKAGENIGSIHYHFGGKEQLFEEVLRTITLKHRQNPISGILKEHEDELGSSCGQARLVRKIVDRFFTVIFDPENPWWHEKLIYRIISLKNSHSRYIIDKVINPDMHDLTMFFKRVKPKWTDEELIVYARVFQAPIILHTQNISTGVSHREKSLRPQVLENLKEITIRQNLFLLGLPLEER